MFLFPFSKGFPSSSDGKASDCNAGDPGSTPGLGRSPEEGNGNPLQNPFLQKRSLMGCNRWGRKESGITNAYLYFNQNNVSQ